MPEMPSEDLASFVSRMGGDRALRVEENLGQGYVRLRVAEAERRQAHHDIRCSEDIVIEMLRNARDASAHRIFVATGREGNRRAIVMLDDGSRFAIVDLYVPDEVDPGELDWKPAHLEGTGDACEAALLEDGTCVVLFEGEGDLFLAVPQP